MNDRFKRAMGATERMRLWFPDANVVMVARIRGPLSEQDLVGALIKARRIHPQLGARVELDSEGRGCFTTDDVPRIPVDILPRGEDENWQDQVQTELERPWPVGRGPLCHFVLLRGTDTSDLVINAHHSICDARSLTGLICDVLTLIADPAREIAPVIPPALEDAVPTSASGGLFFRLLMKGMNRKWLKKDLSFDERDYRNMHRAFWETHAATIHSWSLSAAQTAALVTRCREQQVSVNSALYLAFLAAQHRIQGEREAFDNVLVPVDFRRYLTQRAEKALGLYASMMQFRFRYPADQPFWKTARRFDTRLKRQLTDRKVLAAQSMNGLHPSLLDGLAFAMFGELDDEMAIRLTERFQSKIRTGILVSNLGRLDLPVEYGKLRLEAIVPPAVYASNAEKALEVLTYRGRMFLTLTFDASVVGEDTVHAVQEEAIRVLADPNRD